MKTFCLPYAGGGSDVYDFLTKYNNVKNEFIALSYPGHGNRLSEMAQDDMKGLVASLYEEIRQVVSQQEHICLLGISMGTMVAYELYLKLREEYSIKGLVLLSSGFIGDQQFGDSRLAKLPKEKFMNKIYLMGNLPAVVMADKDLFEFFYNVIHRDYKMIDEYYPDQPLPSIDVPVLLGRGTKDDSVPKSSFEKWSSIIMADSLIKEYEGDHFFIYDSDNSFINDLNDFLEKVGY